MVCHALMKPAVLQMIHSASVYRSEEELEVKN
jgi:hypothetical protein